MSSTTHRRHADETTQRDLSTETRTNTTRRHTQPSLKQPPPPPQHHPPTRKVIAKCSSAKNTQQTRHEETRTETVICIATAGAETRARQHDQLSARTLDVVWWWCVVVVCGGGGADEILRTCVYPYVWWWWCVVCGVLCGVCSSFASKGWSQNYHKMVQATCMRKELMQRSTKKMVVEGWCFKT